LKNCSLGLDASVLIDVSMHGVVLVVIVPMDEII